MAVRKADDTPFEVLVVESNLGEASQVRDALAESQYECQITEVGDGEKALSSLGLNGYNPEARRPDLVFLDLNLPRVDGREVLSQIRSDPDLQLVPVIVLTASEAEKDALYSDGLHANSYVTKPPNPEEFSDILRAVRAYWQATSGPSSGL